MCVCLLSPKKKSSLEKMIPKTTLSYKLIMFFYLSVKILLIKKPTEISILGMLICVLECFRLFFNTLPPTSDTEPLEARGASASHSINYLWGINGNLISTESRDNFNIPRTLRPFIGKEKVCLLISTSKE